MSSLIVRTADRLGYFHEQRIKVDLLPFDSGANEVGPLNSHNIDVAAGEPSARLYESVALGSEARIVAPAVSDPPGYGAQPLVVRSDEVKSGRFKSLHDLKGMTVAVGAPGTSSWSMLNELVKRGDLQMSDVKPLALPYDSHQQALSSSVADAALLPEPDASQAVKDGLATRVMGNDEFYPNQDVSVAIYSGDFISKRKDVATKFMHAYVQGARAYNAAVVNGKLRGPNSGTITRIMSDARPNMDPKVVRSSTPLGVDPDARLNMASLQRDLSFFQSQGLVAAHVHAKDAVDTSFATATVAMIGPYQSKISAQAKPAPQVTAKAQGSGSSGSGANLGDWAALALIGAAGLLIIGKVFIDVRRG
jgi:NitT/TauT family transport system substrate-binding protein